MKKTIKKTACIIALAAAIANTAVYAASEEIKIIGGSAISIDANTGKITVVPVGDASTTESTVLEGIDLEATNTEDVDVDVDADAETETAGSMDNFEVDAAHFKLFIDVPDTRWYYKDVTLSTRMDIIQGVGDSYFNPEGHLTEAEALTLAVRVNAIYYGRQDEAEAMAAKLKANGSHWAKGYEDYAYKYGVLDINSYGKRNLDADCSRYVMAELFAKALPTHEYNTINSWSKSPNLNEKNPNVKQLFLSGIMIGDENGFRGGDPITRAEAACIINRVAVKDNRQQIKTTGHGSGGFVAPEENPPVVDTQFNYDEYNNKAIVDYLTTLRSDPEYGHGAPPAANHSPAARLIHIGAMEAAGIKQGGTKTYTLEEVSAGDMVRIVGGPYADSYTTVLVLERKENSIVVIEFNLNGMIHYGNEFTFSELAQCSEVKVQRLY